MSMPTVCSEVDCRYSRFEWQEADGNDDTRCDTGLIYHAVGTMPSSPMVAAAHKNSIRRQSSLR